MEKEAALPNDAPSSMTLMDISWRSGRCGKLRLEANEHVYVC